MQQLLNRHDVVGKFPRLMEDGIFGRKTAEAIYRYQMNVLKMSFPDEVVEVNGGTLKKLLEVPRPYLIPAAPSKPTPAHPDTPLSNQPLMAGLSEKTNITNAQYSAAAERIGCEPAAIRAVTEVESSGQPFDEQGRAIILFEPVKFSYYTHHLWDKTNPQISLRRHLRKKNGHIDSAAEHGTSAEQYSRFNQAYPLDSRATIMSTSWGKFQTMGFNYKAAGFATPEAMMAAMQRSAHDQLQAFVNHVLSNARLTQALRSKSWAAFAQSYNGSDYQTNHYDERLAAAYHRYAGK